MNLMDLAPQLQEHVVFHLTGKRSGAGLEAIEGLALKPALYARFHDLTRLRYDFPLALVEDAPDDEYLRTLSGTVDALLKSLAPEGIAGERMRKSLLRLEREIRVLMRDGESGTLQSLWRAAAARLAARGGEPLEQDLARAQAALGFDGELLDCDGAMPARVAAHAWRTVQRTKARRVRRDIDALVLRLSDLIKADFMRSEAGRRAAALEAGIGGAHRGLFDFGAMARLLAGPSGESALPRSRRRRIEAALEVLRAERFFAAEGGHGYEFDDARAAIAAWRERLPQMAALARAMTIAGLEAEGRYVEAKHDALFDAWGPGSLGPQERALFPDYLVRQSATAQAALIDALACGAPLKILLEADELLEESPGGDGRVGLGAQIAASAMALNEVYVLQSAAANLYRARHKLLAAMKHAGAALLSVYPGTAPSHYLSSAAAMQARLFPAFSYDPAAGADWAARFSLEDNPQPAEAWPQHAIAYADGAMQRVAETLPFTPADFAAGDARYARHFARVPRQAWNGSLAPLGQWLARPASGVPETVPCVYAIDGESRLQKLIVDETLVHAARQCGDAWRRLQALEGFKRKGAAPPAEAQAAVKPAEEKPAPAAPAEAAQEKRAPGDPYIETERCSSCNECTNLNNVMFAYNENKQAYIANADGGTFRELVEAAESCQVAIIHPGKPRNSKEEGLEELVARADSFQ